MNRNKQIIKASIYGIVVNVTLVIFKIIVGLISGSIAIVLDAINNLSDAVSSIITIVGTKLAEKPADRSHPFGYGRIEYLTSVIIAVIILLTGFSALEESIQKVLNPTQTDYTIYTFIILVAAVIVKLSFGLYLKKVGKKLNAGSLIASGTDAVMDSIISFSTIVSAIIYISFKLNIDGYLGIVISVFILKTGFDILKESLGSIIGNRTDRTIVEHMQQTIDSFPEVLGVYDVILHDYGPNEMIGSVHIEVSDSLTAKEIDELSRKISGKIYIEYGIILTIGIYATNTSKQEFLDIKKEVRSIISHYPMILQMHGFYVAEDKKRITFDLVFDFDTKDATEIINQIKGKLKKMYPQYEFHIIQDSAFSI